MAVDKCDNMRMVETLEDVDFGGKVILEFLIELRQVHRLDGNVGARFLSGNKRSAFELGTNAARSVHDSPYEHPGIPSRSFLGRFHQVSCIDRWTSRSGRSRVTSEYAEPPWLSQSEYVTVPMSRREALGENSHQLLTTTTTAAVMKTSGAARGPSGEPGSGGLCSCRVEGKENRRNNEYGKVRRPAAELGR